MKKFSLFLIFFSFFVFADELNDSFAAAVQAGNVKTASEVFAKGADINFVDEDWPLFVTAVTSGDVAMTEFFIKNGVNLELKGPDGKTALLHAISLKNKKLVDMIIAAGAEIKTEDAAGKDTLMYAAEANNAELLNKLLKMFVAKFGYDKEVKIEPISLEDERIGLYEGFSVPSIKGVRISCPYFIS